MKSNTLTPELLDKMDELIEPKHYIEKHGQDIPEVCAWRWNL